MIVGPDAQPEILFAEPRDRLRHEARAEIALLTRLIRDELRALPLCGPGQRGRIRGWILAAQAGRRARLAALYRLNSDVTTDAGSPAETKAA